MKKVIFLFTSLLLMSFSASAYDNYNKPFIFIENGVEYAVFRDGQFDFNILNPVHNYGHVSINTRNINFSFNTGHNYDAFVQYDDYGAVVQIENTTIDYDYFGKVRRIGNVHLYYNHAGLVSGIGNLHITYNGHVAHCSGYVNNYNINYAFRPHHRYYRVPVTTRCVVYNRPYRRYYTPRRCDYVVYRRNYHTNYYHRPYRSRNYYHPGERITHTRTVVTTPRRYTNNRVVVDTPRKYTNNRVVVNTPRKKVVIKDSPTRRVYKARDNRSANTRTYSSRSNSNNKYVYRKKDVQPNRSYSSNTRTTTSSREYATRSNNSNTNGSYRRR